MVLFWKKEFEELPDTKYASVLQFVTDKYPPTFITDVNTASFETQNKALVSALQSKGVSVDSLSFDKTVAGEIGHEYQLRIDTPEGHEAFKKTLEFLSKTNPQQSRITLDQIVSARWTWKETVMSDDTVIRPERNGSPFTITLTADGKVSVTTDCNNGTGTYSVSENNKITFSPIAMTKKFCQGSKEDVFVEQSSQVDSFIYKNIGLYLLLKVDSGSMEFIPPAN